MKASWMLILVAVLVAGILGSPAVSVGAPCLLDNFSIPGVLDVSWSSSDLDKKASATVVITLYKLQLDTAGWFFYPDSSDPSYWTAYFSAQGRLLQPGETADWAAFSQKGGARRNGVDLNLRSFLSAAWVYDEKGDKTYTYRAVGGNFWLSPAELYDTTFDYHEYPEWDDPSTTRWYADLYVHGRFVGSDLAEARAMGAQFVTPEPATLCLLGLGFSAFLLKRRRQ